MRVPFNPHFTANQGGYSRDKAVELYDKMGSKSAVCVNDADLARMIIARGGVPILRMGAPEDDDLDARGIDPVEYADAMHNALLVAEAGLSGVKGISYIGNEIGSSSPKRTAKWFDAVIRRSNFHKRPVCVLNFAVRNPLPLLIAEFGTFIPALRENLQYGGGEMGFHEGTYIDPNTGEVVDTLDRAIATGAIGGYKRFVQEYGIRARITEFAASKSPNHGYSTWIGSERFGKLAEDSLNRVYLEDGVEVHPFTAFKWDRGEGFEYVEDTTVIKKFYELNRSYIYKEYSDVSYLTWNFGNVVQDGKVESSANINIRNRPGTDGSVLGLLRNGETITYWDNPFENGNYKWYRVMFNNQLGYVANTANLKLSRVDGGSNPTGLTPEQIAELKELQTDFDKFVKGVVPSSNGITF